ncbi:hypothetical protein J6590_097409 [Homalodisca vitripennis]|nr:hypothetical protein J6590_097409 [Homalodisca vitripennis]
MLTHVAIDLKCRVRDSKTCFASNRVAGNAYVIVSETNSRGHRVPSGNAYVIVSETNSRGHRVPSGNAYVIVSADE